ncbi:hypothetical protein [Aureimonas sp. D3]|uniref:hypothetical protein n=1 Tax=Aureimonas sp. D3 TaxID=1638164 RepID=UPI000AFA1C4C|nr:hypothetical protein [Aureimonas sp. D3]
MATAKAIREEAEWLRVMSTGDYIVECGKLEDHRREMARADALDRVAAELERLAGARS